MASEHSLRLGPRGTGTRMMLRPGLSRNCLGTHARGSNIPGKVAAVEHWAKATTVAAPSFDWTAIAAIAAVVASVIAIVALIDQAVRGRRTEGFDFLWRFTEAWDSTDNRTRRQRVATQLLIKPRTTSRLAIDILNSFEQLGLYVRSSALHRRNAWAMFYGFAIGYWFACKARIEVKQGEVSVEFDEFAYLIREFMKIEAKERRKQGEHVTPADLEPSEEDVDEFLRNEAELSEVISLPPPPPAPAPSSGGTASPTG